MPRPPAVDRSRLQTAIALGVGIFVLIMSLFAPGGSGQAAPHIPVVPGQIVATGVHPFHQEAPVTTERRVPLLEVFTATWCPPCGPADRAIDRLLEEKSPGLSDSRQDHDATADANATSPGSKRIDLAVLAYHPWPDPEGEDPFGTPEGHDRVTSKYDAFWFPSTYVDGFLEEAAEDRSTAVDAGMEEVLYHSYSGLIKRAAAIPEAFRMTTEWAEEEGEVTVMVDLEATADVDGAFFVRGVLWEDHLHFRGSNGIDDHRMTVRTLSERQVLPPLAPGETWSGTFTLRIPEGVDLSRSGVTFFVESAWGQEEGPTAGTLMGFALGTGAVAAGVVFLMRRGMRRGPRETPAAGGSEAPAVAASLRQEGSS